MHYVLCTHGLHVFESRAIALLQSYNTVPVELPKPSQEMVVVAGRSIAVAIIRCTGPVLPQRRTTLCHLVPHARQRRLQCQRHQQVGLVQLQQCGKDVFVANKSCRQVTTCCDFPQERLANRIELLLGSNMNFRERRYNSVLPWQ